MRHEELVYSLPYLDPANYSGNSTFETYFYCSYVNYVEDGQLFKLNPNEELDTINSLCQFRSTFKLTMLCITLILGVPGNVVAILTMLTMPKSTGTFYILVLAISDLTAIALRGTNRILDHHHVPLPPEFCRFRYLATNYVIIFANWVLVLICVERFVTVRFPLKKRFYYTMKTAKLSVLALLLLLSPVPIVEAVTITSRQGTCTYAYDHKIFYTTVWPYVVLALYSFVPVTLVFVFVVLVAVSLKRHRREREDMMAHGLGHGGNENPVMRRQRLEMEKMERAITTMMFITFIIFLLITIPVCITIIVYYELDKVTMTPVLEAKRNVLLDITAALNLLNHAVNFYIYFLSAMKFRSHMLKLFRKCVCLRHPASDAIDDSKESEIMELS